MAVFQVNNDLRVETAEGQLVVVRPSQLAEEGGGYVVVRPGEVKGLIAALTEAALHVVDQAVSSEPRADVVAEAEYVARVADDGG